MTTIDRTSPVPMHFQLKQILLEKISGGAWKPGDLIPGESDLQATYGLSRTTVRQTLSDLVYEGRLVRERGRGTFVAQPKFEHNPARHRGISQYLKEQGLAQGWKVLSQGLTQATDEVRQHLRLEPGAQVYCLRRLRLANNEPIGYLVAYVPEALAAGINPQALEEGESLRYLASLPQMHHSRVERSLEAVAARKTEAKLLGIKAGTPVMLIQRRVLGEDGAPIEFLQALYRGDRLKYQFTTSEQNGNK